MQLTFFTSNISLKIRLYSFCLLHNISYCINEYGSIVLSGSSFSIINLQKFFSDDFKRFNTKTQIEATLL